MLATDAEVLILGKLAFRWGLGAAGAAATSRGKPGSSWKAVEKL